MMESQRRVSSEWISEKDSLMIQLITTESKLEKIDTVWKEKISDLEGKVISLESSIASKDAHIKQLVIVNVAEAVS
jgi:hypothetical protein